MPKQGKPNYPRFDTLLALADFFDVSLDYLVFGKEQRVSGVADYGPLARYVDHSLARVQDRAAHHSATVARVGTILANRIDEAVRGASALAQTAGMLHDDETLAVEEFSLDTSLVSMNLDYDFLQLESSEDAPGRFFQVVTDNLSQGYPYRFLLPGHFRSDWPAVVNRYRALISTRLPGDVWNKSLSFRICESPLFVGMGIYRLDVPRMERQASLLLEQIRPYVHDGYIAYTIPPSAELLSDCLFDEIHLTKARERFEDLWKKSKRI